MIFKTFRKVLLSRYWYILFSHLRKLRFREAKWFARGPKLIHGARTKTISYSRVLSYCPLLPLCCAVLSRFSCVWLFVALWTVAHQAPLSMDSPGKNTGVGCHAFLQEIFSTQVSNPCLSHLPHWQARSLPLGPPVKSLLPLTWKWKKKILH